MEKPIITEEIILDSEYDLVLYADPCEFQSVYKIQPDGVLVQYYEYGVYYNEKFKTYEELTSSELDKVIIYTNKLNLI